MLNVNSSASKQFIGQCCTIFPAVLVSSGSYSGPVGVYQGPLHTKKSTTTCDVHELGMNFVGLQLQFQHGASHTTTRSILQSFNPNPSRNLNVLFCVYSLRLWTEATQKHVNCKRLMGHPIQLGSLAGCGLLARTSFSFSFRTNFPQLSFDCIHDLAEGQQLLVQVLNEQSCYWLIGSPYIISD